MSEDDLEDDTTDLLTANAARREHYAALVAALSPGERPPLLPGWRWRERGDGVLQAERPINAQIGACLTTQEQLIHDLVRIEEWTLEHPIRWGHVPAWSPAKRLAQIQAHPDDPGADDALTALLAAHPELREEESAMSADDTPALPVPPDLPGWLWEHDEHGYRLVLPTDGLITNWVAAWPIAEADARAIVTARAEMAALGWAVTATTDARGRRYWQAQRGEYVRGAHDLITLAAMVAFSHDAVVARERRERAVQFSLFGGAS